MTVNYRTKSCKKLVTGECEDISFISLIFKYLWLYSFQAVIVSGAKLSEESAYPTEAVKIFHEKPLPTHDKGAPTKPKIIHQPKK
jgi:Death-associated protein